MPLILSRRCLSRGEAEPRLVTTLPFQHPSRSRPRTMLTNRWPGHTRLTHNRNATGHPEHRALMMELFATLAAIRTFMRLSAISSDVE